VEALHWVEVAFSEAVPWVEVAFPYYRLPC